MYELVYSSTASPTLSKEDLNAILETAHAFNASHGITGCLLYHKGHFLQILEGEQGVIESLYQRIIRDQRHTNLVLLSEGDKNERVFSQWSMAFHELTDDDMQNLNRQVFIDNFITFAELADKPTFPMILFWNEARQLLQK